MRGSTPHLVKCTLSIVTCVHLQCKVTTYCQLTDEGGQGDFLRFKERSYGGRKDIF